MSFNPVNLTNQLIHTAMENVIPPSIHLPLDILAAIADIEAQAKKCLEGCRITGEPYVDGCLLDIDKVKEIMLATGAALFRTRAEFQESQPGFGTEGDERAIDEAINRTFSVVPLAFGFSSRYKESKTGIAIELEVELHQMATKRLSQLATGSGGPVQRRKPGRPIKIPIEAKERALAAKSSGATQREVAAWLYQTRNPTPQQKKNVGNVLGNYERSLERTKKP
jgi:hypothetical protein